jgi:hypothetical protein
VDLQESFFFKKVRFIGINMSPVQSDTRLMMARSSRIILLSFILALGCVGAFLGKEAVPMRARDAASPNAEHGLETTIGPATQIRLSGTNSTPDEPGHLTAIALFYSILLIWSAPDSKNGAPVTSYQVYLTGMDYPTEGGYSFFFYDILIVTLNSTVPCYLVTNLTPGIDYTYQVCAVNGAVDGQRSNESSARVPSDTSFYLFLLITIGVSLFFVLGLISNHKRINDEERKKHISLEARFQFNEEQADIRERRINKRLMKKKERKINMAITKESRKRDLEKKQLKNRMKRKARQEVKVKPESADPLLDQGLVEEKAAAVKRALAKPGPSTAIPDAGERLDIVYRNENRRRAVKRNEPMRGGAPEGSPAGIVTMAILRAYVTRMRNDGIAELPFPRIRNDLDITSQNQTRRLRRFLELLVGEGVLVQRPWAYVIS